jgi:cytochrome c peroxidase
VQKKQHPRLRVLTSSTLNKLGKLARRRAVTAGLALTALGATPSCAGKADEPEPQAIAEQPSALVAATPESACDNDPRVWSGLVPRNICIGARVFFDEKFGGNGRTCGSCHPANNNFTIDRTFMQGLPASDPLFINENPSFPLSELETAELKSFGLIRENVDGFGDLSHKFVLRSVPHLFGLSTSIARDTTDGTSATFAERTGWSGDGVTGGTLREFANGAIEQHFTKDLGRTPGTSFRRATDAELDRLREFQLALGRRNELNLANVRLTDSFAEQGRQEFLDPQIGRCNECHGNAGANARATGKNANFFGNFERFAADLPSMPVLNGVTIRDGGFGGQGLAAPNVAVSVNNPTLNAFGDGSFNTASLIEAADTGPFFHHNNLGSEGPSINFPAAITFYSSDAFNSSPAGQKLIAQFGTPITLPGNSIVDIAAFLRVLNTFFNLDLASQRLQAAKRLNNDYWDYRTDIQRGLLGLGRKEVADALRVLSSNDGPPLHTAEQSTLSTIIAKLDAAGAATDPAARLSLTNEAISAITALRPRFGTGVSFTLGTGTLMF